MEILYTDSNGVTTKFTEDMAIAAIKERDELREQLSNAVSTASRHWDKVQLIRQTVWSFFAEDFDPSAEDITISVGDINDMLEEIGCDRLKRYFTVSGTIDFTITDIEATSEDEARDMVENNMSLEFDGSQVDDWNLDVRNVDEQ
jgi:hypothetical protein